MDEDGFAVAYIDLPLSVFAVAAVERGRIMILINALLNPEQRKTELEKIKGALEKQRAPEPK